MKFVIILTMQFLRLRGEDYNLFCGGAYKFLNVTDFDLKTFDVDDMNHKLKKVLRFLQKYMNPILKHQSNQITILYSQIKKRSIDNFFNTSFLIEITCRMNDMIIFRV